jgi:hypothetical protein
VPSAKADSDCFTCAFPAPCRAFTSRRDAAGGQVSPLSPGSCIRPCFLRTSARPSSMIPLIPSLKNYGTISNAVFSLPPSLRPALVHAGTPCGQWITVQFPKAMPE